MKVLLRSKKFTLLRSKKFTLLRSNKLHLFLAILLITILIRFIFLGQFPNGFTGDEAQQGYSAYSILKTDRDEWGQFLPLNPRGFGDFKPPLYTYLTIPSVALFGLTIEAVRIPAASVGVLTVVVVFFLAYELFKSYQVAFWSMLLTSISPWHIQVSRTAWEGGAGVLFSCLGLLFYLKARSKSYYLIWAAICWGLTLYSYHSFRVFMVLFIVGLICLTRKEIKLMKHKYIALAILVIFSAPLVLNLNSITSRSKDVGINSPKALIGYFESKSGSSLPPQIERIFDNKILFVGESFFNNYLSYFSPTFLLTGSRPDNTYLNFPYFPLLYPIELIFWLWAIYFLIFKRSEHSRIILLWFLLAPIPAALAEGSMNANRAVTLLPVVPIISGIGASKLLESLSAKFSLKSVFSSTTLLIIAMVSFCYFLHFYFYKLPQKPIDNLRFGYRQTFKKVLEVESSYDRVFFSKVFTEPQIFIAFYGKVDPIRYQKASQDWLRYEAADVSYIDQLPSWNFEKYLFEDIDWKNMHSKKENALIVSSPRDFPEGAVSILDVKDPKGEVLYRLVPTRYAAK